MQALLIYVCAHVCVCVCARARARASTCVYIQHLLYLRFVILSSISTGLFGPLSTIGVCSNLVAHPHWKTSHAVLLSIRYPPILSLLGTDGPKSAKGEAISEALYGISGRNSHF